GSYPASYALDNIISVAAVDNAGALSYFSNYGGSSVDIAAPGEDVYSTWLKDGYYVASGTSMATPHVTGTIALMLAKYPKLTTAEIESDLTSTVVVEDSLASSIASSGVLNAGSAVHLAAVQRSQAKGTYALASAASVASLASIASIASTASLASTGVLSGVSIQTNAAVFSSTPITVADSDPRALLIA
ncbi:MAG: subtilase family protein, partial [Phycisphaerales bacterium]|nr:subtilase family protein [Phycisphaerales bacterium]